MVVVEVAMRLILMFARKTRDRKTKKADVDEHPGVFVHVGLLGNEPPGHGRAALHLVVRRLTLRRGIQVFRDSLHYNPILGPGAAMSMSIAFIVPAAGGRL